MTHLLRNFCLLALSVIAGSHTLFAEDFTDCTDVQCSSFKDHTAANFTACCQKHTDVTNDPSVKKIMARILPPGLGPFAVPPENTSALPMTDTTKDQFIKSQEAKNWAEEHARYVEEHCHGQNRSDIDCGGAGNSNQ